VSISNKSIKFHIVDVFAERKYEGNQLAVFEHRGELTTEEMQSIAKEINFAESTFIDITTLDNNAIDVRIFDAESEYPFAGHPTLGTAYIIREILNKPVSKLILNYKIGPIEVEFLNDMLWMEQVNPSFRGNYDKSEVASFLNISLEDIDQDFPIEEVSTGLPSIIVPIKSKAAIERIKVDLENWKIFMKKNELFHTNSPSGRTTGIFVFTKETVHPENDFHARKFWYTPICALEDAATGSANGCLLGYLLKNKYLDTTKVKVRVEQGFEISRPSILELEGKIIAEDEYLVRVGGKVQKIASGDWMY
jgi:trans-2,3-dihydro-3-hydroxyanthranilate isomerase